MIVAMAMLPLMAKAQANIDKIWTKVENGNIGTQNGMQMENGTDAEGKKWTYVYYGILVKNGSSELKQLQEAFKSDRKDAYSVFIKKAGFKDGVDGTTTIGYADDTKSIRFGADSKCNYEVLLFRDKKNEMYRTAYVLMWLDSDDKGYTQCKVFRFYGRDPQKIKAKNNQSVTIQSDGTIIKYDGNSNNSVVLRPQKTDADSVKVKDGTDFLLRFNKLRTDYTQAVDFAGKDHAFYADRIMQPVNEILLLCRKYHTLLSTGEQSTCANILADMQKQSRDKGVTEMLELSRKYLLGY